MIISSAFTIALLLAAHNTSRPLRIDMVKCELWEEEDPYGKVTAA